MEAIGILLLQMLGVAFGLWLPGVLLAWLANPSWTWPWRLSVGFVLGTLTVPLAAFAAAWLLETSVTPAVVLGVATLLILATAPGLWWRRRRAHAG